MNFDFVDEAQIDLFDADLNFSDDEMVPYMFASLAPKKKVTFHNKDAADKNRKMFLSAVPSLMKLIEAIKTGKYVNRDSDHASRSPKPPADQPNDNHDNDDDDDESTPKKYNHRKQGSVVEELLMATLDEYVDDEEDTADIQWLAEQAMNEFETLAKQNDALFKEQEGYKKECETLRAENADLWQQLQQAFQSALVERPQNADNDDRDGDGDDMKIEENNHFNDDQKKIQELQETVAALQQKVNDMEAGEQSHVDKILSLQQLSEHNSHALKQHLANEEEAEYTEVEEEVEVEVTDDEAEAINVEKMVAELNEYRQQKMELEKQNKDLVNHTEEMTTLIENAQTEKEALLKEIEQMKQSNGDTEVAQAQKRNELQAQYEQLKAKQEHDRQAIEDLQDKLEKSKTMINTLREENREYEQELVKLNETSMQQMYSVVHALESTDKRMEERDVLQSAQVTHMKQENDEMSRQMSNILMLITQNKQQWMRDVQQLNEELQDKANTNEEYKAWIEDMIQRKQWTLMQTNKQIERLRTIVVTQDKQIKHLKRRNYFTEAFGCDCNGFAPKL